MSCKSLIFLFLIILGIVSIYTPVEAKKISKNRYCTIDPEDRRIARKNPASHFAYGLSIKPLQCGIQIK